MGENWWSIVKWLVCGLILIWVWKFYNWVWLKPKRAEKSLRQQGLKGNSYRFLIGDLKETSKLRNEAKKKTLPFTNDFFSHLFPFHHQHFNKYGQNCWTWLGPIPVINIADPELIKEVFSRMNEFKKAKLNPLVALLVPGLVSAEGDKWVKHRRLINPAFHMGKLKLMHPAFNASVSELVNKWEKIVSKTGSSEIDLWPHFSSLTADAISRAAFGSSYEEGRMIFELVLEQMELALRLLQSVPIPGKRFLPTKTNRRMKQLNSDIQKLLVAIIDKRKKEMEAGEPAKDDLLGTLLDSNFKDSSERNQKRKLSMTFQDIVDECKLFYLAGQESTSVLLTWTLLLLSKHQDWQTRAREEVLATFGKNEPDFDGLHQLKILTMILHEVMRLYPPVCTISRMVFDDETKLGHLTIPCGSMVSMSALYTHHDPKFWGDDALEFNPERFSEGVAKATKGSTVFFPFGWGPRICIGQNFALIEAKLAVAMILQRFSFELAPTYAHSPTTVLTLQPQHGAQVILHQL
ncbi:unnamed protein product [Amaranthus hypochondriacus]